MLQRLVDWLQAKRFNIVASTLLSAEKTLAEILVHMQAKADRHREAVTAAQTAQDIHTEEQAKVVLLAANVSKLFNQPL